MGKFKYLLITLGIAAVMGIALLLYVNLGCNYHGTEFSPDDFTVRYFSYSYEPITDWVIRGRSFEDDYYSIMLPDLVGDAYIKPIFKKDKTWHLLEDNGTYSQEFPSDSDARLLVDFLILDDENDENLWTVWNTDHPKLAKIFWPAIAQMARDEIYLTVGDVLTFAIDSDHSDPKLFEADLRKEVAKAYLKLGKIDFDNSDLESAEYRVKKSIKYHSDPDAKSLLNTIQSAESLEETPIPSAD